MDFINSEGALKLILPIIDWILLVALLGLFVERSLVPGWRTLNTDFPNYCLTAVHRTQGAPVARAYEWIWFQRQKNHHEIPQPLVGFVPNPPCAPRRCFHGLRFFLKLRNRGASEIRHPDACPIKGHTNGLTSNGEGAKERAGGRQQLRHHRAVKVRHPDVGPVIRNATGPTSGGEGSKNCPAGGELGDVVAAEIRNPD